MAGSVNRVILVGRLGQNPETKYTQSNQPVVNVSLATSESWNDKNTGQRQERTEWHRLVFFNKLAEIAGQYLKKGSQVYVEGSLRTRKWQGQDGRDNYTTEIVVSDMQMLGQSSNGQANNVSSGAGYSGSGRQQHAQSHQNEGGFYGDDIPF